MKGVHYKTTIVLMSDQELDENFVVGDFKSLGHYVDNGDGVWVASAKCEAIPGPLPWPEEDELD